MTILLLFSEILLKLITFLVICYLLAKESRIEKKKTDMTTFSMISKRRFTYGTCIEETKRGLRNEKDKSTCDRRSRFFGITSL